MDINPHVIEPPNFRKHLTKINSEPSNFNNKWHDFISLSTWPLFLVGFLTLKSLTLYYVGQLSPRFIALAYFPHYQSMYNTYVQTVSISSDDSLFLSFNFMRQTVIGKYVYPKSGDRNVFSQDTWSKLRMTFFCFTFSNFSNNFQLIAPNEKWMILKFLDITIFQQWKLAILKT